MFFIPPYFYEYKGNDMFQSEFYQFNSSSYNL